MYMIFASLCAAAVTWMYPGVRQTILCAASNATASAINNYKAFREHLKKLKRRGEMVKEIIHNYRTGAVSLTTLLDFALFKCRMYSTELFENGLVIDHGGPTIEIIYYLRDTRHRIVTPKRTGPRPILRIESSDGHDLREKLGPYGNFHGIPTTPSMLGYPDGVNVTYRSGRRVVTYTGNDPIAIE